MGKLTSMRALLGVSAMALGAVVLAGGGVVGCGSADTGSPSAPSLKSGLNILSADPAVGVSAAYVANGRVVYLQTRVGPLKEKLYRDTYPNEPQHEMDMRAVDQEGRTFILMMAADQLVEPTWAADMQKQAPIASPAEGGQRQDDFALARDAANAFAAQAGPELADHVFHLTNMTRVVPQEDAAMQARLSLAESKLPAERVYNNGCGCNLQEGDLYAKPFAIIAQHSSVDAWNLNDCGKGQTSAWSGWGWDEHIVTCNHGTCANDSSMSYQGAAYSNGWEACSSGVDLANYFSNEQSQVTTGGSTGGCATHYGIDVADITVYGGGDPNHECNDDSALELQEITSGAYIAGNWSGGGYACYFTSHWYGPLDSAFYAPTNYATYGGSDEPGR
jgi:hypothetical protein